MLDVTERLLAAAEGGAPVLSAAVLDRAERTDLQVGQRFLVEPGGETLGSLGDPALDQLIKDFAPDAFTRHAVETIYFAEGRLSERAVAGAPAIYIEVVESKPVFLVVGAGHVGRCVATMANFLDFHVAVLDDRPDFADPEQLPQANQVICDDFEEALDQFPINANTYIVLVTRGHKQDELSLRRVLNRGAAYIGMIGSKRRTGAVLEHLRDDGFPAEELGRVRTPIGLSIGAETPEEIAVSILGEVVMQRNGGDGTPMYYRRGKLQVE